MVDIGWPLEDGVQITITRKAGDIFFIQDVNSDRELTLSWDGTSPNVSRLLFNGQDIETEEFIGYVGLMDEVVELLGSKGVGTVTLERNHW
jgi:hypothetical protein